MEMFAFLSSNEFANEIDVVFMCAFVIFGIHIEIVTRQFIFSLSLNRNKMCLSFLRQGKSLLCLHSPQPKFCLEVTKSLTDK